MGDPLDDLASIIAERALQRLRAERIGREQPTCAPVTPADLPKECDAGGCAPCEEHLGCSARGLLETGTARLTPLAIRTSRDLAPYIDHTLLKPDAKAVIEIANLKRDNAITTLAWDVCDAVSQVLDFEGEIVIGWQTPYGYGYDHSYCLVFRKAK
jgi:hypothetical protein